MNPIKVACNYIRDVISTTSLITSKVKPKVSNS